MIESGLIHVYYMCILIELGEVERVTRFRLEGNDMRVLHSEVTGSSCAEFSIEYSNENTRPAAQKCKLQTANCEQQTANCEAKS